MVKIHRGRRRALLALGVSLASRGFLAKLSIAIAAMVTFGMLVASMRLARHSSDAARALLPMASTVLAWSAGVLLAITASMRALRNDREDGIVLLARIRGCTAGTYTVMRVAGLAILLILVQAGGILLIGLSSFTVTGRIDSLFVFASTMIAALVYAVAFAFVIAPLVFASFGTGSRFFGYLGFLAVLFIPEACAHSWPKDFFTEWKEVVSIFSALQTLRAGLFKLDGLRCARSIFILFAYAFFALWFVRTRMVRLATEEPL